jgi:hypothetical protein
MVVLAGNLIAEECPPDQLDGVVADLREVLTGSAGLPLGPRNR